MRSFMISRRGLDNSRSSLAVAGAKIWRVRGRVQLAVVVGLLSLAGLGLMIGSSLLAEEPEPAVPTIKGFQVTWAEADPEENTYTFTFSGTITNCENLLDPTINLFGYPFDTSVTPDSTGAFSVQLTENGDFGFGRTVIATIIEGGETVSEEAYTST